LFVDDVQLPGMLHVAFVRSEHAHGRVRGIDVSAAHQRNGVVAVYTAADLGGYLKPGPVLVTPRQSPGWCSRARRHRSRRRRCGTSASLSHDRGRKPCIAEDAVRDVDRHRTARRGRHLERALTTGARSCEDLPSNVAAHVVQRKGEYAEARRQAGLLVKRRFAYDRGASAAIENRAVAVDWNGKVEELIVWDTTQAPIPIRKGPRGDAGVARVAGERDRTVRRRRLRAQDHDVLPRGAAAAMGGNAPEPAAQVDRGSP
jgi:CO/xanthine dehydrogenase Mo-binding subunit